MKYSSWKVVIEFPKRIPMEWLYNSANILLEIFLRRVKYCMKGGSQKCNTKNTHANQIEVLMK